MQGYLLSRPESLLGFLLVLLLSVSSCYGIRECNGCKEKDVESIPAISGLENIKTSLPQEILKDGKLPPLAKGHPWFKKSDHALPLPPLPKKIFPHLPLPPKIPFKKPKIFPHLPLPPKIPFKKPCPPPLVEPKPTPKPPVIEPPPIPVYEPKPPVFKPPTIPIYKPKPEPPVFKPPTIPIYKPKPEPPIYKPKPEPKPLPPFHKKPCPPFSLPKLPPLPTIPPKFHHPIIPVPPHP